MKHSWGGSIQPAIFGIEHLRAVDVMLPIIDNHRAPASLLQSKPEMRVTPYKNFMHKTLYKGMFKNMRSHGSPEFLQYSIQDIHL